MSQKKNRRRAQGAPRPIVRTGVSGQWVFAVFLFGLMFGGFVGYFIGAATSPGAAGSIIADAYGRSPSHPHYNHNHP